eukprot:6181419-Pleurochrysis_carterae.AAC.4
MQKCSKQHALSYAGRLYKLLPLGSVPVPTKTPKATRLRIAHTALIQSDVQLSSAKANCGTASSSINASCCCTVVLCGSSALCLR